MKILALADLYDLTYEDIKYHFVQNELSYDIIALLGNIDSDIITNISSVLRKNNLKKRIIGVKGDRDNQAFFVNGVEDIHLKNFLIFDKSFLGFSNFKELNCSENDIGSCDVLITHCSPKGINNIISEGKKEVYDYICKYNPDICIHGNQQANSITLVDNTYVIGVFGISIIDTDDYSVIRCY